MDQFVSIAVLNGPHLEKLFDISEGEAASAYLDYCYSNYQGRWTQTLLTKKDERKLLGFANACSSNIDMARAAQHL